MAQYVSLITCAECNHKISTGETHPYQMTFQFSKIHNMTEVQLESQQVRVVDCTHCQSVIDIRDGSTVIKPIPIQLWLDPL